MARQENLLRLGGKRESILIGIENATEVSLATGVETLDGAEAGK